MQCVLEPVPIVRVPHNIYFGKGRTKYGGMGYFATQTASDASIQDRSHWVVT